ncbi:titin-like isoform X43 [Ptychodera flava]|uniref:titin-like isoform X43 n=1 Tax=Ptychodera flava TaxID=63121 RepID=UPI00396A6194
MAFVVVLQGGSPWGFRLIGGKEFGVPLRIAKINPGSKAAKASIEVGDIVYSINGQSTDELEHNDALSLVKSSKDSIELHLRRTTSPLSPITNTSTIYRSTSNGPTEDSSEEQSEDMTETTTKTVMMNSDQGSIADYEDSLIRAGLGDVDLQNLPSNVAVVKKTTTKVTKITRCTSPARWSSSESLTSTEGDRKRERQQPPITVQVSSAAEPGSDSPKLLHVWSPPLSGGEASPVSPPFPTNSHLQVPEQVQQTATKSDVTKLIKEIDSRPPHPPPRHSGPDVKRAYYTDQSAVASPPTRRKKVKTTLFIRPRSNSFDATTSRSWTPVNFKTVSKDDNERTLTSPPPTVPPPPQMYEYYPVITQGPKTVKTSLILQPEANRRRARDRRAFTPLARSTSVPPQLDFINGTHATNRVRGEDMFALRKRQHKMWDKRDMTDESAAVPKINPAAVPQNTYTDPTSPPTTTTLDSLPLPSPPPPLTMSDNAEVVTNHEPLEPVKVNANPISPKPGVWTPGQPSSTISTDSFNKDRDANFNVAPVWKPFGGDMPKKEFKAVKLELNSDKPKETEPEEKDIPPPPPPPPMPSESYAWRPPTPPAKEEPPAPEAPKPAEPPSPQNKGFTKYQPNGPTSSGLPSTVSPTITLLQHNRDEDTPPRPPSPPPQYGGGLLCTPSDPPKGGNETEEPAPSPPPETNTPAESPPVSSQPPTELVCQGSKEPSPVRALPMREVTPVRSPPPGEMTPVWSPPAMEFRTVTAPPASNPIAPIPTVSSQSVDSDLPPSRPNLPDEMTACTPQPSSQEMIPPVHSLPRHMIKPVHPPPRDMTRTVNQFPKDETLETYPVPGTVAPTEHPPSGLPTPTVHTASQELPQGTEQQPSTYTEYQQPRTMTPIEHPPPKAMEHPPPRTEAFIVHPPPRETPAPTYYQMPRVTTPVNYQPPREVTPTEQPQPQNIIPIEHSQPIEITPTENPPPRPMAPLSYPTPREVTLNQYQPTTEMTPIPDPPRRVMTPISAQPMRVMTPVKYQDSEEAFPQRPSPPRGMISPPPRIMSPVASSPPAKFFTPATPPPRDMTSQPVRYQPFEEPAPPRPLPPAEIVTAPPRAMQPPATPPPRGVLHAATPPPRSMAPPATPPPRDMVPPSTPPPRHMTPMATPPPRDMIPPATPPPREMVPPATPPHRGMMPPATPPPRETGPVRRVPGGYHQLQRATASSNFPTEIILTPPTPREVQPPARPAPPQQTTPFGGHPRVHTNPLPSPPPPREMTPTQQPQPYSQIHPQQRPPPTQGAPTVIYQRPPTPQGMPPTVQNPPPREDLAHGWRPTEDQAKIANTNLYVVTDPKDHHIKETIKTHEIEGETVLKDKVIYAEPNFQVVTDANQLPPGAVYQTKTVEGDVIHTDTYYPVKVPGSTETTRRVVRQSGKYEGIGPVDTESGMPIGLRSGVQEDKRHDWYKEMYKSIHRQEKKDDENPYRPTYIFPDDKVDRTQKVTEKDVSPTRKAGQQWAIPSARNTIERYQQQPRSITDYEPGKSSLAAKEKSTTAHMHNPPLEKTERAKSPPYISGSRTLPASYRRSDQVSPRQTQSQLYPDTRHQSPPAHSPPVISHDLYKNIQKGGDIPIHGLRKPEDEQEKASKINKTSEHRVSMSAVEQLRVRSPDQKSKKAPAQNRYSAGDLYNYRGPAGPISPSSNLNKERIIEEERMRKKEQEKEQDRWRRHSDNSPMKSPIITNERFEDPAELARQKELQKKRAQEVKVPARALYPFSAQNAKELSFKKGDVIYIIRQVDKNWLEGEHHGRVGIFPTNYVEAIQSADIKSPQPVSNEGKGQAKYNFKGETNMELSLNKGDSVILIRKVDNNWYEGKLGNRQGIFPASYIEVITEPVSPAPKSPAPAGYSPQHSPAMRQQQQQQQQQLSPVRQQQSQSPPRARQDPGYPQQQYSQPLQSQTPPSRPQQQPPPSHPPTHAAQPQPQQQYYPSSAPAPLPAVQEHFRAIYPYAPQNEDELELFEGDVVVVMEKCDDGWFVGTSTRTGQFGTFPGNYVERM